MTKSPKAKLSRRQREEQLQTRRWMLMSGGILAAAAAGGVGLSFLNPAFSSIDGDMPLDDRISAAGLSDHLMKLTPGRSTILVIGTTDCIHCRAFVKDGLEETAKFAADAGIGFVFGPTGGSASSLGSTRLISGLAAAGVSHVDAIRAVYDASPRLGTDEGIVEVAREIGARFAVSEAGIDRILNEGNLEVTQRIQALGRAFPIKGTPIFFVESAADKKRISWFSGWAGVGGLQRQIQSAREV